MILAIANKVIAMTLLESLKIKITLSLGPNKIRENFKNDVTVPTLINVYKNI